MSEFRHLKFNFLGGWSVNYEICCKKLQLIYLILIIHNILNNYYITYKNNTNYFCITY